VEQVGGGACHTGHESCFYSKVGQGRELITVEKKVFDPEKVYRR